MWQWQTCCNIRMNSSCSLILHVSVQAYNEFQHVQTVRQLWGRIQKWVGQMIIGLLLILMELIHQPLIRNLCLGE
jgi:hypothetical protein